MRPSSRTPEGTPNRCPVCGKRLRLEPSQPTLDAPCPHCGHLLWFESGGQRAGSGKELHEVIMLLGGDRFGPPSSAIRAAIKSITEWDRLQAIVERMLVCRSWEELVAG